MKEPAMRRAVPVDWDALEWALTDLSREWTQYLDLATGQVERVCHDPLMMATATEGDLSEDEAEAGVAEGRLIPIESLPASVEYSWMVAFAGSVSAPLREKLELALDGSGAFRRFKNVLLEFPEERERWFAFRDARLHEAAREWLADHDIEPAAGPQERER